MRATHLFLLLLPLPAAVLIALNPLTISIVRSASGDPVQTASRTPDDLSERFSDQRWSGADEGP